MGVSSEIDPCGLNEQESYPLSTKAQTGYRHVSATRGNNIRVNRYNYEDLRIITFSDRSAKSLSSGYMPEPATTSEFFS